MAAIIETTALGFSVPQALARLEPAGLDLTPDHAPAPDSLSRVLIVIPTLNEGAHIHGVLSSLLRNLPPGPTRVVVVDGGSSDETCAIVQALAATHPELSLLHNPARIQSAAVNLAARTFGRDYDVLVRCDAHATYPDDFCRRLLETLAARQADAVVVPMRSTGTTPLQRAVAWVSNSPIGTGGSAHRSGARSGFVDHGHHAAFRLDTFRRAGGYDETLSHNEDAELDCRQRALGARVYLAAELPLGYFPRASFVALARQYFAYGDGRSRTLRRHPSSLRLRQLAVPVNFLGLLFALPFGPTHPWVLAWPALYFGTLAGASLWFACKHRSLSGLLAGPAAGVMHLAWAYGFLTGLLRRRQVVWLRESNKPLWEDEASDARHAGLRAWLVDPSLFTGPYDGALTRGLKAAGVHARWAVRPVRPGDQRELAEEASEEIFYRRTDQLTRLPGPLRAAAKGVSHLVGLLELVRRVSATKPDVVHFQWLILPLFDALAIALIRRTCPVIVTVHDSMPYNGDRSKLLQALAADLPLRLADRLVVLAQSARERLVSRGFAKSRISVIPHGPMPLPEPTPSGEPDTRFTFVLFGELKTYKGIDVLIEAVGLLPAELRSWMRVIIAGRPQMSLKEPLARITELGLGSVIEVWPRRLPEQEMANLFGAADCFVFPYRQIDASGVYYQAKAKPKWIIASRVGIFAEDLADGVRGALVEPEDPHALAMALAYALVERPVPQSDSPDTSWANIGNSTRNVYRLARAEWSTGR
jgi:succinoglycan biosynthesis protein ExoA